MSEGPRIFWRGGENGFYYHYATKSIIKIFVWLHKDFTYFYAENDLGGFFVILL